MNQSISDTTILKRRKFTLFRLELRPLSFWDKIILSIYFLAIVSHYIALSIDYSYRIYGLIFICFGISWITVTTTIGTRFRGVYFSLVWVILCLSMIYTGTRLAYAPIGTFFIYQLFRFIFWRHHKNEFIPFSLGRNLNIRLNTIFKMHLDRFVSRTEKRGGHKEDKKYMKVLVWVGAIFIFYCLWGLIGLKFE